MRPLPPSSLTPASASAVYPSPDSLQENSSAHIDSTGKSRTTSNLPSSSSSDKPRIPKLSASTTELLARVNGYMKGGNASWLGYNHDNRNGVTGLNLYGSLSSSSTHLNKMKASSAIIELPTAPFECSRTAAATPAASSVTVSKEDHAKPLQHQPTQPAGLVAIAPKLIGAQTSCPHAQEPTIPAGMTATPAASSIASPKRVKSSAASRNRRSATNGGRRSGKRHRDGDSDGEDIIRAGDSSSDESDVTPTATQTKSGRQVHRPSVYVPPSSTPSTGKGSAAPMNASDGRVATSGAAAPPRKRRRVYRKGKDVNISCCHCQRGHSPSTNAIVFCDICNDAWHQLCHDPPIDSEVIIVKEKKWFCRECKPVPYQIIQPTVVRSDPDKSIASVQPPPVIPKLEVGGVNFSAAERRGYLSNLSHATLVELLVTLSDLHPSLEIFPANLSGLQLSKFSSQRNTSTTQPESLINNATMTDSNGEKHHEETPNMGQSSSEPSNRKTHGSVSDDSDFEEFQEHRLYPRAGNGFRLSLNADDLDILREDPRCPTFSYELHGPAKSRMEANEAVPMWGAA